ncbi:hypothetical protein [Actinocorallia longicatena]
MTSLLVMAPFLTGCNGGDDAVEPAPVPTRSVPFTPPVVTPQAPVVP